MDFGVAVVRVKHGENRMHQEVVSIRITQIMIMMMEMMTEMMMVMMTEMITEIVVAAVMVVIPSVLWRVPPLDLLLRAQRRTMMRERRRPKNPRPKNPTRQARKLAPSLGNQRRNPRRRLQLPPRNDQPARRGRRQS